MTRAELIDLLVAKMPKLSIKLVEDAVKEVFEQMSKALETGSRIEIRGFGSFSLRFRKPRMARNPRTGAGIMTHKKYTPHFKPGKELRERVNEALHSQQEN